MRTTEERIVQLHARAHELQRRREKRRLTGLGSLSAAFTVLLGVLMVRVNDLSPVTGDQLTGSSLLSDSTGGYVMAAVIAFFVGVALTTVIFRSRRH